MDKLENQPCPFCGKNTLTLTEDEVEIPYFGNVFIFGMVCDNCKYSKSDVECEEMKDPTRYTLMIEKEEDMNIRVVKSSTATVRFPGLRMSVEPGADSEGFVSNVEGVIKRFEEIVEKERDLADEEDVRKSAKNLLKKIRKVKFGELPTKLIIEDPSGNSAIISEKAVLEKLKVKK